MLAKLGPYRLGRSQAQGRNTDMNVCMLVTSDDETGAQPVTPRQTQATQRDLDSPLAASERARISAVVSAPSRKLGHAQACHSWVWASNRGFGPRTRRRRLLARRVPTIVWERHPSRDRAKS